VIAFPPVSLLRRRDVRLLSLGSLFESVGMVGEQVVLGWLTLELTNSPLAVGLALGLRMAPMLVAGLPAGVIADRSDRVRLLRLSGYGMGAASALLGVLTLAGVVALWHVLLVTVASGCVRTLFQTARQSYTHDLVGPGELVHAVALLGVHMRVGGLAGSLLTGALTARLGPGAGYLGVAAGFLAGTLVFSRMPPAGSVATARESVWAGFVDFVRALRRDRVLPGLIALTAAAEVLGFSHQALLPSLARDVLRVGADGLGVMTGARSVGGILGIAAIGVLSQTGRTGSLFLGVLIVFGASLVVLGFASSFLWVVLLLVLVNAVGSVSDVLSQSLVQLSAPRAQRGRAGGAWVLAIGTAPLGQLQIGALASLLGVSTALGLHGLALVALAAAGALWFPRLRRL
jgi:MFS family permease